MTSPLAVSPTTGSLGQTTIMAETVGGGGGSSSSPGKHRGSTAAEKATTTPTYQSVIISLTSGAMAGAVAKTVIAPLDRTKIYFQTHPDKSYRLKRAFKYIHTTCKTEVGGLSVRN